MHHRPHPHRSPLAAASKRWLAPLSLALLLAACGGGAPLPLAVTDLSPANGATGVAIDVVLSATFDRAIDADTLAGAFTLAATAGGDVAGAVTLSGDGRTATFTPDADLATGTTYTASVAGSVATTDGATLGGEANWTFTTLDPATLPQSFSFQVANPDDLSGAIFAPVYEAFGTFPGVLASNGVTTSQATAIRDAMDGATLALSGAVAGTLTPAAELSRINEAIGFFIGGGAQAFFVPEGCDATTVNATEAAFATTFELMVWDGTTLDANGIPATQDGFLDLAVVDGDVETRYVLVASRSAWSATTNGACAIDADTTYALNLDVAAGWQFLVVTFDATVGAEVITFETRSLEDVAAAGVIGTAEVSGGVVLAQQADRLTPIYR